MKYLIASASMALTLPAVAQDAYPERAINLVVPFAAGGPSDTIARLTAEALSARLGQQVLVENVVGAGGTLASSRVSTSAPDGYTLLIHHVGMSTAPALYDNLDYDPMTSFSPVGLVSDAPMTVIGRSDFPAADAQELIAYIRENDVSFANSGQGAASHLCGALFMASIGTAMTEVPYTGNGPIMTDLLGKHIDLTCDQTTNTIGPISEGLVKAYAITSPERSDLLPDLVTGSEAGLPDFSLSVWHGIYAPAGTPEPVIAELSQALQEVVASDDMAARLADLATLPAAAEEATPAALSSKLEAEIAKWGPILANAGATTN